MVVAHFLGKAVIALALLCCGAPLRMGGARWLALLECSFYRGWAMLASSLRGKGTLPKRGRDWQVHTVLEAYLPWLDGACPGALGLWSSS